MFRTALKSIPILFLFMSIAVYSEDPPLSVLLEKGIFAEETEGNLDEAIKIYRQIADKTEANREIVAQAKLRLGECYLQLAKIQFQSLADQYGDQEATVSKARTRLTSMGEKESSPAEGPLASEDLTAEGWRLWGKSKRDEAEGKFESATQADPKNANAWNGLGWSQFNQGKAQTAKAAFEKCLEIEPRHPAALNGLGWIAKRDGKTDEAIGYWTRAIDAEPGATAALNGLATSYMWQKDYEKAAEVYEAWLKVEPSNQDAVAGLEKARKGEPQPDPNRGATDPAEFIEACEAKMKAVKAADIGGYKDKKTLDSEYERFVEERKPSDSEKGDIYKRVEEYLAAHANDEDYAWRVPHLLSKIALDLGREEEAAAHLDSALQAYPQADYPIPSKHSKFQHLLNERAGMIWDKEGVEAAEDFILEKLKTDPRFEYLFWGWWEDRYEKGAQPDRVGPMLEKIDAAYRARAEQFPEKASQIEAYRKELES